MTTPVAAPLAPTTIVATEALTEIEALGLASKHDLANGHASQDLAPSQQNIINNLPSLWRIASGMKASEAADIFKSAFQQLAQAPSLSEYRNFKICPTASNSIDTVAAWLVERGLKTALIEPTFDNLYLILKRRGVNLTSLPEECLHTSSKEPAAVQLDFRNVLSTVDAVFVVNPNNPTGRVLSETDFTRLVEWCAVNRKVLILDNTFRFFVPQNYDTYKILLDSGVTFLSIEDTGKVWPTQEIKASLLFTSQNIFKEVDLIYDEIFLCHSSFALAILSEFLNDAGARGLDEAVWKTVEIRRQQFRKVLDGKILQVAPVAMSSNLSVEWVEIKNHFASDMDMIEHFKTLNLVFLPGRQFYWSGAKEGEQTCFVRFALLKPEEEFKTALEVLATELERLSK